MWEIIQDLVTGGVTVFLATQYLEEVDQLADRIALLDHGRLVAEGTPAELRRLVAGGHLLLRFTDLDALDRAADAVDASGRDDEALTLTVASDGGVRSLRTLLDRLDSECRLRPPRHPAAQHCDRGTGTATRTSGSGSRTTPGRSAVPLVEPARGRTDGPPCHHHQPCCLVHLSSHR
jgi:hypothetical protein